MGLVETYIIIIILLVVALFISFYFYSMEKKNHELKMQEYSFVHKKHTFLENEHNELVERNKNIELNYAVLKTKYEEEQRSWGEKLALLQNAKDDLSKEFSLLSHKIFQERSKEFSSVSKEQLELLLHPFREQITRFSKEAKEQFHTQTKERYLLKNELHRLQTLNSQLSQDAMNLTKALKGENKTQGNWGEIILENILEKSGLREGSEYELQATRKSNEGKSYRPDVILHMPQNRDIIIDSKVSLNAYERFVNAESAEFKSKALKEHIVSIKTHIKELSKKQYENLEGVNSLDFVLLFMPIEGAFLLALEQDGEFFKSAYEQNILVVSPSTLLVTLRTIEHIWRTQRQEEHAQKIAKEAEAMYDKLVGFVDEMQKVGSHLQKAQESYDTSMNRLKSGRGNIIKRAENIVALGVKSTKKLNLISEDG